MFDKNQDVVIVAFGANQGDPAKTLSEALTELVKRNVLPVKVAPFYVNPALTLEGHRVESGRPYQNTVFSVATAFSPEDLLQELLEVETLLGRVRTPGCRFEPRTIDLDLICYGQRCMDSLALKLPHPEMSRRDFVLKPMSIIAPQWGHPQFNLSVVEMLEKLSPDSSSATM